jgi:hypothetical protein
MMRFRKRRKLDLGTYVAPEETPPTPLKDLVDEGVLIASAAVRLAVKNLMIVKSIRDSVDYDMVRYVSAVREEVLNLAHEKDADADRIAKTRQTAGQRSGRPEHHSDYRSVDTETLVRREDVSRQLAARLRELSEDEEWVVDHVARARASALDEIASSLASTLLGTSIADDDAYQEARPARLRLLAEDLLHLQTTPPDTLDL